MLSFNLLTTILLLSATALALPTSHPHTHPHRHTKTKRSSSKRGAAYNDASLVPALSNFGSITWAYDWNMNAMGNLPSNIEFVPMLWGPKMFPEWSSSIQTLLSPGNSNSNSNSTGPSTSILGFNEPDRADQASMSSSEAVTAYREYITPFAGQARLVSPGVTNAVGPDVGLDWMRNFLSACSDCGISAMAVHWYGESAEDFKNFVTQAVELAGQFGIAETWVTEFALNGDIAGAGATEESRAFLREVLPWLDDQAGVTRYAYFMCAEGYLLEGGGLSLSGKAYVS